MILVYFVSLEIGPMILIIYILQKTSQDVSEDILPSAFNSFISRDERFSEAAYNIVNKLFVRSSLSRDLSRLRSSSSHVGSNIQDEDIRFKKRGSARI